MLNVYHICYRGTFIEGHDNMNIITCVQSRSPNKGYPLPQLVGGEECCLLMYDETTILSHLIKLIS